MINHPSPRRHHEPRLRSRRALWASALLALSVLAAACSSATGSAAGSDAASGAITNGFTHRFSTFEGDQSTLSTMAAGQPVVLNFFASTCAPCVTELPEFERVHQATKDDVVFIGLATDGDRPEDAARLIEATGVTFAVGLDTADSQFLRHYQGLGMPTTVFINADGTVADRWTGVLSEDALTDKIDDLLR